MNVYEPALSNFKVQVLFEKVSVPPDGAVPQSASEAAFAGIAMSDEPNPNREIPTALVIFFKNIPKNECFLIVCQQQASIVPHG
jgi:hypothetical protein